MAEIAHRLKTLAENWAGARAGERANLQLYVVELCEALGVGRPQPRGTGYEFELQIDAISVEGTEAKNFIDCWKAGHFALEGKDDAPTKKGSTANEALLRRAYGQVRNYVHHVPGEAPPPYLMVLDVGKTLIVWDRWSGVYGGFEAGHRIDLATLHRRPDDIALLRDVWEHPAARDRRGRAQAVTTEIAGKLARLAAALEGRGHPQEEVARFLMRVVFSCFAEDVGLLPAESFRQTVTEAGLKGSPAEFTAAVEGLWRLMDIGGRVGPLKLLRFNGHFFQDATALPLTRDELALLEAAARADWAEVEPAIFGTLLTRALDPEERHRLGAEYTPPAFIERLVRPTVEEPLRARWTAVEAEVVQLLESGKPKDRDRAAERVEAFHDALLGLRFLDPACGSGNFLYVTMHLVKNIEVEVLRTLERVTGQAGLRLKEVTPAQFYGIEVKPWAREIAELTLWIGFHQFWRRHHDVQPPEPILQDTGTLDRRDAVLAWDAIRHDSARDRPDPTPRLRHPVTGELVPDPAARLRYDEYVGAQPAPWPDADFIVGNPPYLGEKRQREVLGDGYVDALRAAYPAVGASADYVTYWWYRAAEAVASGRTVRAGLITTNSIAQSKNRAVIEAAAEAGVRVTWAVADHVWYDGPDGAEVRVAMTVLAKDPTDARLVTVERVERVRGEVPVVSEVRVPRLNADLTAAADVSGGGGVPLRANAGLAYQGYKRGGDGFVLTAAEARAYIAADPTYASVIKPYRNGKDLTASPRDVYVIDMGLRDEAGARAFPVLFDRLRDRVYPERAANPRASYARFWWRFLEPRRELREALAGLPRYIVTSEVSKHPIFAFVDGDVAPDGTLVCIASGDDYVLGVLSSTAHAVWLRAAGGRMGVRHTPRYSKGACFDPFPFPTPSAALQTQIAAAAQDIEAHRARALAASPEVTMMKMYDVVEALRAGKPLTAAQQRVHAASACGVLRDLHDALDRLVAQAYGWSWPEVDGVVLERLVALHEARVEEERRGQVRWLRPDYQRPRFAGAVTEAGLGGLTVTAAAAPAPATRAPWPADAVGQITALRDLVATAALSVEEAAQRFTGARRELVTRHLETLALLGEVVRDETGRYRLAAGALSAA